MSKSWVMPSFERFGAAEIPDSSTRRHAHKKVSQKVATHELWAEKFFPENLDSLCIHKKKVSEVEEWLCHETSSKEKGKNLLLLTGPAGCGKTSTVKVLCRHHNIDIREWTNPSTYTTNFEKGETFGMQQESQISLFRHFLLRANKYSSLLNGFKSSKRIVLIKDYPNAFFRDQTDFQQLLRRYKQTARSPVVFIITDSVGNDQNERLLFPKHFQSELHMASINFNPVSNTLMTKALNLVIKLADSQRINIPPISKSTTEQIVMSSSGDLRSAVNALQFTCTYSGSQNVDNDTQTKSRKRTKKSQRPTVGDELFCGRDASLSLFRTIGKILYCKRSDSDGASKLPTHLSRFQRNPLTFDPEEVIERGHMSPEWFNLFLHQNYLQFFADMADLVRATEYLSDADFLLTDWTGKNVMELYSASVAARGIMHSNQNMKSSGWRPLHKPEYHTAMTTKKQNETNVKNSISELLKSRLELFTDYIPFVKYFQLPDCYSCGNQNILRSIGIFSSAKGIYERSRRELLNENDIAALDETVNTEVASGRFNSSQVMLEDEDDNPEEFLIEDFSD